MFVFFRKEVVNVVLSKIMKEQDDILTEYQAEEQTCSVCCGVLEIKWVFLLNTLHQ